MIGDYSCLRIVNAIKIYFLIRLSNFLTAITAEDSIDTSLLNSLIISSHDSKPPTKFSN